MQNNYRTPINSLIFFEEMTAIIRAFTSLLFTDNIMATHTFMPPVLCKISNIVSMICIMANVSAAWTIALMRVLYVFYPTMMVFWENRISNRIHIFLFFMTTSFSLAWSLGPMPNRCQPFLMLFHVA